MIYEGYNAEFFILWGKSALANGTYEGCPLAMEVGEPTMVFSKKYTRLSRISKTI